MSDRSLALDTDPKLARQRIKIVSHGRLQVDGEVDGDVAGTEVVIGEHGKVTGTVAGERVTVLGHIVGAIHGKVVALQSSAQVKGDIHHTQLAIEKGAAFDGRCKRPAGPLA
jgi:cytoskeletal protein CcmA (bactofilin family)